MKKKDWFQLIPGLHEPVDIFAGDDFDLVVDKLAQVRRHTIELYGLLNKIDLKSIEYHFGPAELYYKHSSPRELHMDIPLPLPTLKVLSYCMDAPNRGAVMQYALIKEYWNCLVRQILDKNYTENRLQEFYTFEKAIVKVIFHEIDLRTRDADNYCLVLLHNALVGNGIIADDNFERLQYCVSGVGGCEQEKTEILIVEDL